MAYPPHYAMKGRGSAGEQGSSKEQKYFNLLEIKDDYGRTKTHR
jgi:hypothetical protein